MGKPRRAVLMIVVFMAVPAFTAILLMTAAQSLFEPSELGLSIGPQVIAIAPYVSAAAGLMCAVGLLLRAD